MFTRLDIPTVLRRLTPAGKSRWPFVEHFLAEFVRRVTSGEIFWR